MQYRQFAFEKLDVWKRSRVFVKEIYKLSKGFPSEERYNLTSQVRRSASSISSNLAEGGARVSGKEQARFTEISFGSLMETLNHLIIAADLGYISDKSVNNLRPMIEEIANKLNALRKSQLKKDKKSNGGKK
ncbi:MAG: four helix bundle protein [Bacteroidota bacterium]